MYFCRYVIWIRITYNILIILQHFLVREYSEINGTHRENTLSNKTELLTKSRNRNIWVACKSNQIKVLKLKLNFQKNEAVSGKSTFFVIGPFVLPTQFALTLGFWQDSFAQKYYYAFICSTLNFKTNSTPNFFKKL